MIEPTTADLIDASTQVAFTGGALAQRERWAASGRAAWLRFTGQDFATVAATDEPLVFDAVRALAELAALDQDDERQETLKDFDLIQSFSAGSYSETRRTPEDAWKARKLVPLGWLNTRLWDFMTPDKRAYWLDFFAEASEIPATSVTEVDWTRGLDEATAEAPEFYDLPRSTPDWG